MSSSISLLLDKEIASANEDSLDFWVYAETLSQAICSTEGPFTIGVFGGWGTGKTSLLKMLEENLSSCEDILTVWFNAWQYEKSEQPIIPLIVTIMDAIKTHKTLWGKAGDKATEVLKALASIIASLTVGFKVGGATLEASLGGGESQEPFNDIYVRLYRGLDRIALSSGKIVVLIDDLDRCMPDVAIKLLEHIKLFLWQRGFIFVLAMDRAVIEAYLQKKYRHEFGLSEFHARRYLDKIIQLPFYIPPHGSRIPQFWSHLLEHLEGDVVQDLESLTSIVAWASGNNPRSVVRFLNNLLVDRYINDLLAAKGKMESIPLSFFAISRSLQQRAPEVYEILAREDHLCEVVARAHGNIQILIKSGDESVAQLAKLLGEEPSLVALLASPVGEEWLTNHAVRRNAIEFLNVQRPEKQIDALEELVEVIQM